MRSSILGFYHPGGVFRPSATNNGQFDKLTDRTEGAQAPELAEGALTKPYIYTVAHASGSESSVLFPWLMLLLVLPSVFFRVRPWLIFCFWLVFFPWLSLLRYRLL
jgi:hypothetical protein